MFHLKLSLTGLLVLTFYGLISCSEDSVNKQLTPQESNEQLDKTLSEFVKNDTHSRSGRTLLTHNVKPAFTLRRRQPIQIRGRTDYFPIRTQVRRIHNGQAQQQNMRLGYESLKSSKYMPPSKGSSLPFSNNGKGSPHRPQLLGAHPNSINVPALSQQYIHNFKASPTFNGQVVVHPAPQTQNQQPSAIRQDNSYPKYIKPQQQHTATAVVSQQSPSQLQQKPALIKYPEFKQYPIPDHEQLQRHNEQHEKFLQQQKFLASKTPIAYYQTQHTQQQHQEVAPQPHQNFAVQQPPQYLSQAEQKQPSIPIHASTQNNNKNNINNVAFPAATAVPTKMYSVYEESDMTELKTNNHQAGTFQGLDKAAQEYLRFMGTEEYFLPKRDPNYKSIDDETDKKNYNVLKSQPQQHLHSLQQSQSSASYQYPQSQKSSRPQQLYTPSSASQGTQYSNSLHSDASEASGSQGIPVSRLFYHQEPSTTGSASSTVLRTSYQTGYNQNQFVVNSQDKKYSKYTILPSSTTNAIPISTQSPVVYAELRYKAANRTPEPVRFEFTERDAMIGAFPYTHAPYGQLRYKELTSNSVTPFAGRFESSTAGALKSQSNASGKNYVKPVVEEVEDDPEEGDDMQGVGNNLFGRQTLGSSESKSNKASSTTIAPPSEQKDTEEYCERICAIVEDENEEIVCGSDGYMYTSEAQMECYASCLHIDVTIQGKGSCSKR